MMTEIHSFEELQRQIQALYQVGEYQSALELATAQSANFPEQFHLLYYWRICMAARTRQVDLALDLMDEILNRNFWYGEGLLRKSPSLHGLQGLPAFEKRLARNAALRAEAEKFPLLILHSAGECTKGEKPCPLLIGLHANASNAQDSIYFWRAAASYGWLVAVPQSSQAMWKGAYVWDDQDIASAEISKRHKSLLSQYAVDEQRLVIAGHSMGGETAIWLALAGILPARGFIAIGPGGPRMEDIESWGRLIAENPNRELRGYLITGREDNSIPHQNVRSLARLLNQAGIATETEEIPDVGHDYSSEYAESLLRGLEFITEGY